MNIVLALCFGLSLFTYAQEHPEQKSKTKSLTEISYSSQAEKDKSIKDQETRLLINLNDPSYPKDALEKEKQTLKDSKKAIINSKK